jgi:predicted TIM-barrel fold metal-dependent hydrolase
LVWRVGFIGNILEIHNKRIEYSIKGDYMIVDAHVHTGGFGGYSTEEVLRIADRAGFDKIFATDTVALKYDMVEGNRQLAADMKRHPDRIIGYATISSARFGRAAVDEVRRCHEEYGMRGLKIVHKVVGRGSYQMLTTINEPVMYPIVAAAAEYGMVILAHSTPEECAGILDAVPNAKILMAHSGGCPTALGDWFRAIEVAKHYPNLYLDSASSQIDMGYVEAMVEGVGAERVIFGTDMPLIDPFFGLAKVTGANLTQEEKEFVLGKNIMRILE